MRKLDRKVAIVTGGARGLGREYAHHLANLGAKVVVCDIDLRSFREFEGDAKAMTASSTVDEIKDAGGDALGLEFDIGDRDEVFTMVDEVRRVWGRIDILVANAGGGCGSLKETRASMIPLDLLELVTRMNFYGTVHCCSAVAPVMKEQQSGKIVTVASHAGSVATIGGGYAHYGANKAAIAHYTRYLAQELGKFGINANCIAPGMIATGRVSQLVDGDSDSDNKGLISEIALRRYGEPSDCAKVIEFLTTDLSDYVTGALIPIDGGWNRSG
jgi:3-oxoacyl-[acyl-carrier protein] reductase